MWKQIAIITVLLSIAFLAMGFAVFTVNYHDNETCMERGGNIFYMYLYPFDGCLLPKGVSP